MTADMLDEGSGDRSAIQIHEDIARLGTQLETDIGADAVVAGFTVLSRFSDRALGLLADVVAHPALRKDDVGRVRQLRLHRLTQLRDVPSAIADRAFLNLIYGAAPLRSFADRHRTIARLDDRRGCWSVPWACDPAVGRDADCGR